VQRERVSFLLIDHDVDTVLARSSDVVVLEFGHVIARGTPAEIRRSDIVRTAYLGDSVDAGRGASDD
jgi:ABC-type branched-subunit amino acid transport system ATPase component